MEEGLVKRSAIGRIAKIGDLYDIRNDTFLNLNILHPHVKQIEVENSGSTKQLKFIRSPSLKEKFEKLDIEPELQLSILSNLVTPQGHSKFLQSEIPSEETIQRSLVFTQILEKENLKMPKNLEGLSVDALSLDCGTHYVVGITWGIKIVITLEDTSGNTTEKELMEKLSAFSILMLQGKLSPIKHPNSNLSIHIYGDCLPSKEVPTSIEETGAYLLNALLVNSDTCKGAPLSYMLLSISALRESFGTPSPKQRFFSIKDDVIDSFMVMVEEGKYLQMKIQEIVKQFKENGHCIPVSHVRKLQDFCRKLEFKKMELMINLQGSIPPVRGGESNVDTISDAGYELLFDESRKLIEDQEIWLKKIKLVVMLKKRDVTYVGCGTYISEIADIFKNDSYILQFGARLMTADADLWRETENHFFKLLRNANENFFVAVDTDVVKPEDLYKGATTDKPLIIKLKNGNCVDRDVLSTILRQKELSAMPKGSLIIAEAQELLRQQISTQVQDKFRLEMKQQLHANSITRSAVGRMAAIGDLYDIRTDNFVKLSALSRPLPEEMIQVIPTPNVGTSLVETANVIDKIQKLNIEGELATSFLSELVSVDGYGKYLIKRVNFDEKSLIYTSTIQTEHVQFVKKMDQYLIKNAVQSDIGTHIVVGITWGTKLIVTLKENESNYSADSEDLMQELANLLHQIQELPEERLKEQFTSNLDIQVFADRLPNEEMPTTVEEVENFVKEILKISEITGKGTPISYILLPISLLQSYVNFPIPEQVIVNMDNDCINQIITLINCIATIGEYSKKVLKLFEKNEFCIPKNYWRQAKEFLIKSNETEMELKRKLKSAIPAVRCGKKDCEELIEILTNTRSDLLSEDTENWFLEQESWMEKIIFIERLKKKNVQYVRSQDLDDVMKNDCYLLFFGVELEKSNPELWEKTEIYFWELVQSEEKLSIAAVDCDVVTLTSTEVRDISEPRICLITKGSFEDTNVYGTYVEDTFRCYAKSDAFVKRDTPLRRYEFQIVCPGSIYGKCEPEEHKWHCSYCKQILSYGYNDRFYCKCGGAMAKTFHFKCASEHHISDYETFTCKDLNAQLEDFPEMKDLNILVLGLTGVGKSTWINSFFNYLAYPNLDEAAKGKLLAVTSSYFEVTDENDEQHQIAIDCVFDVHKPGQSATEEVTVHLFPVGDTLIRLIDTPGIGDTRGVEHDKKNLKKILTLLATLKDLHGICILLKPNESRFNVLSELAIKELLVHLHKDTALNIAFCFTHSRETFYKPGDTRVPLKALLEKNNVAIKLDKETMYCVDNESFRFLCAQDHGVKFNENVKKAFSESWNISVDETNRLIAHFKTLKPHKINDTISLNDARKNTVCLTKPFADITQTIQEILAQCAWKRNGLTSEISKKNCEREKIQEFLNKMEDYVKKLENEQNKIIEVSVALGHYLSEHAMLPYIDVLGDYIDHLIKQEEEKFAFTKNDETLKRLRKSRLMYDEEDKALKEAMAMPNAKPVTYQTVLRSIQELHQLEINGQQLRDAIKTLSVRENGNREEYEMYHGSRLPRQGGFRSCNQQIGCGGKMQRKKSTVDKTIVDITKQI